MIQRLFAFTLLYLSFATIASEVGSKYDCGFECLFWKGLNESTQKFKREIMEEIETSVSEVMDKVRFLLYTRKNPTRYQSINGTKSIRKSNFQPEKITKIIIHGWYNSYVSDFSQIIKDAYLTRYDGNVVLVDWEEVAHWLYPKSRGAVPYVAEVVAAFLARLLGAGLTPDRLHLVGHSLGAHLAGIAGLRLNSTISRITGLDPASPMFSIHEDDRLSNSSADFVDVIHTCGLMLGFYSALGHVDFYPNGGTPIQPGCGMDFKGKCSHRRSYMYFAESILTPRGFMAVSCPSWDLYTSGECVRGYAEMGEYVPKSARGVYYLETFSEAPYSRGRLNFL